MAGHATTHVDTATAWSGKVSPFNVSYGKLMMWFFLVSDAMEFVWDEFKISLTVYSDWEKA